MDKFMKDRNIIKSKEVQEAEKSFDEWWHEHFGDDEIGKTRANMAFFFKLKQEQKKIED